jgi:hypothetical protein
VHRRELAAAVADLGCQRRWRLPQTIEQASLTAVGRLPNSTLGELQTLLAALEQARTRARAVFANSAPSVPQSTSPATGGAGVASQTTSSSASTQVVTLGG